MVQRLGEEGLTGQPAQHARAQEVAEQVPIAVQGVRCLRSAFHLA